MLNPKTTHLEFGGPVGAAVVTVGLTALINYLFFACNPERCELVGPGVVWEYISSKSLLSSSALKVYLAWMGALILADRIVPGEKVKGTTLRTGEALEYKFNGTGVMVVLFGTLFIRFFTTNGELPELVYIYQHLWELGNASILFAFVLSTLLYVASFRSGALCALGGNSGNIIYDWFIGRELNPRIGSFDLKTFLEMRPGLLLWVLIDLAMAHHQYLTYGSVSNAMILVCLFQGYYVVEGIFYEKGLVSMIDITHDGLGFMLVFGDIALVPFTYTIQSRFLAERPESLGFFAVVGILAVYLLGVSVFRLSNNEKGRFKAGDARTKHLKYIETPTGSKLLVSGWWGVARHINYTGDWVASWAYCLPCGLAVVPYYYVLYFLGLLVHRETRDEAKCAAKYGETWEEYKKRVPWRFIPGVY